MVLRGAAAGRRGPKWGSRPPEGRAIAGLKAALIPTEGLFFAAKGAIKTKIVKVKTCISALYWL